MTAALKTYTVNEACEILKVHRDTLRRLERRRELMPVVVCNGPKGKRSLRYRESDLLRYLERKTLAVR